MNRKENTTASTPETVLRARFTGILGEVINYIDFFLYFHYKYDIIQCVLLHINLGEGDNDMTINKTNEGNKLTVAIEGRLDTTTAPQLEEEFKASLDGVQDLVLDFSKLEYISSAGLRVLLSAQKQMNKVGKMTLTNVSPEIMEIFEVTGFSDILSFA